jgi:chemotaxis protein histidine kinase CheA
MSKTDKHSESMLVRGEDLDRLLVLAGEVIIASSNHGLVHKNLQTLFDKKDSVDQETLNTSKDLASSTSLLSSDLHRLVQSIRTVNLKDMGFRARRLVRDISRKTGKLINFEIIGEEITIDKAIVDKLYDPVSHQLRNAVDHGIEDIQTRTRKDKQKEGRVVLNVYNTELETVIEIKDDGAGIPMDALHRRCVEEGILGENDPMTEEIALDLMCTPGFTTSETVSKISGRGVGMDVVKNSIDNLGGTFSFKTEAGKGTTFTFLIPLASAVNIVDALVVRAAESIYAFPISNVVGSISMTKEEISSALNNGKMVKYLGNLLPLHSLNKLIEKEVGKIDWTDENANIPILIIEHKGKKIALTVAEFLAPQKLVIIPFNESISVTGLIGSTILGGRKLGYIVDVPSLIDLAMGNETRDVTRKVKDKEAEEIETTEAAVVHEPTESEFATDEINYTQPESSIAVKQDFISELEKLIQELNEIVFSLESDPSDNEKINAAFRLFHTIKGNLIMMGLPKGGETIHCIESVLDNTRSGKVEFTTEMMDIIMDGVSYIEDVVRNMKADNWEDRVAEEILEQSADLIPKQSLEQNEITDVASEEITLTHESEYRALMHRKNKSQFYHMYIEFDSGPQPSFLVACLIYKRICDMGDVLGTVPPLSDIEKGVMDGKMKILFTSNHKLDLMKKALKDLFTKHYGAHLVNLTSVSY